jgi:uncharacterized protein YggU (UPF0235/DUF167 family)
MADKRAKGVWADLAVPGMVIAVRVTPGGRANLLSRDGETLRITVTAAPEDGRATAAVTVMLAEALGVAKTRLVLIAGASHRDKRFRLD